VISVRVPLLVVAFVTACGGSSEPSQPSQGTWREIGDANVRVEYQDPDASLAPAMLEHARAGRTAAAAFFGEAFATGFTLRVYPDRPSLVAYWRSQWGQSFTPWCWLVASATRTLAVTFSPRLWQADTCGHVGNAAELRSIMTHEIIHVLNGQLNTLTEVNDVLAMKWLTEGIAWYAAGQFDDRGRSQVRTLIAGGYSPTSLDRMWWDEGGYDAAGSVIAYIDTTYGRSALRQLLRATSNADAAARLGLSEATLLQRWREQASR
jgi:hypothetical protein